MTMPAFPRLRGLLIAALHVLFVHAALAGDAGTVRIAIGETWLETPAGERFSLAAGQAVPAGATLVTGDGLVQVSFADGGLMSIQKHTRLRIERFVYDGTEDGAEWALFELVRGGLHAISGAIGHARKERYGLRTAFGTIGIRGTAFNALVCEAECQVEGGPILAAGLHAQTTEGMIFIRNDAAVLDVPAGRSAFVPDVMTPPVFSTFTPDFAARRTPGAQDGGDGAEDRPGAAQREKSRGVPKDNGPAPSVSVKTRIAGTALSPARVRILSAPGKPLVVGMKADIRPALALATARLNADLYGIVPPASAPVANAAAASAAAAIRAPAPPARAVARQALPAAGASAAVRASSAHNQTVVRIATGHPVRGLSLPSAVPASALKTAPVTLPSVKP